jgi:hypothetical protein
MVVGLCLLEHLDSIFYQCNYFLFESYELEIKDLLEVDHMSFLGQILFEESKDLSFLWHLTLVSVIKLDVSFEWSPYSLRLI